MDNPKLTFFKEEYEKTLKNLADTSVGISIYANQMLAKSKGLIDKAEMLEGLIEEEQPEQGGEDPQDPQEE